MVIRTFPLPFTNTHIISVFFVTNYINITQGGEYGSDKLIKSSIGCGHHDASKWKKTVYPTITITTSATAKKHLPIHTPQSIIIS